MAESDTLSALLQGNEDEFVGLAQTLYAESLRPLEGALAEEQRAAQRRARVEVIVKAAYPGILDEVAAGGGPNLIAAFDAAGVPAGDRAARVTQMQGDLGFYAGSPGALVAALVGFGA